MRNRGVLTTERRPRDLVGAALPFEVRISDGNWESYLPDTENQKFGTLETYGCVSFSLINALETQEFFLTGQKVNYSDRWLAMMSGTVVGGNTLGQVADTVRKYGLVKEESWPTPLNPTWSSYYAVPNAQKMAELKAEGQRWLRNHEFTYAYLGLDQATIIKHLQHTPLQVVKPGHAIESFCFNKPTDVVKYFDTYSPFKKTIKRTGLSDVLKPLLIIKDSMRLVNENGTFYVEGEKGKIGIADMPFLTALRTITNMEEVRPSIGPQVKVVESVNHLDTFKIKDN